VLDLLKPASMPNQLMRTICKRIASHDDAATSVEYAIMLALVLIITIGAIGFLGTRTQQSWTNSNNSLSTVNFGS
jgi:Flp pilus assembly pilin Flp